MVQQLPAPPLEAVTYNLTALCVEGRRRTERFRTQAETVKEARRQAVQRGS